MACSSRPQSYQIDLTAEHDAVEYEYQALQPGPHHLQMDDRIEVSWLKDLARLQRPYHLQIGDRIEVAVANRPEVGHSSAILPDGSITLPRLGTVPAAGLSVEALRNDLQQRYAAHFTEPHINVLVLEAGQPAAEAIAALESNPDRLARRITISEPMLRLPFIEAIPVLGRTLDDVQTHLQQAYDQAVPGLAVHVALVDTPKQAIAIFGEVDRPTRISTRTPLPLTDIIASAGGLTDRAGSNTILAVMASEDRQSVRVRQFALSGAPREGEAAAWSALIDPGETVYVPRSAIANINLWIDQYLRRNIPIGTSLGFYIPVEL